MKVANIGKLTTSNPYVWTGHIPPNLFHVNMVLYFNARLLLGEFSTGR
jgi:hypothetical protein